MILKSPQRQQRGPSHSSARTTICSPKCRAAHAPLPVPLWSSSPASPPSSRAYNSHLLSSLHHLHLYRVETLTLLLCEDYTVRCGECGAVRENATAPHGGHASDESSRTCSIRPTRALPLAEAYTSCPMPNSNMSMRSMIRCPRLICKQNNCPSLIL